MLNEDYASLREGIRRFDNTIIQEILFSHIIRLKGELTEFGIDVDDLSAVPTNLEEIFLKMVNFKTFVTHK